MKFTELLKQMPEFIGAKGCNDDTIVSYENALNVRFAPDYREYLSRIGLAYFDGRELTGISKTPRLSVVEVTREERELNKGVPADFYVVEETGVDGIVVWQASSGSVYITKPGTKPKKICESLTEYIAR